jgi:hypothetical protein
MSAVMDAIYSARLRELAGFLALPAEQLAHAMTLAGGDPVKITAVANMLTADPGAEPIPLPRSWSKSEHGALWTTLPPLIQRIVSDREFSRDREVRKKQDEAAKLRHENERLTALLQPTADEPEQQPTTKEPDNGKKESVRRPLFQAAENSR